MAKFSGLIGYVINTETSPGVWMDVVTEKHYRGDELHTINRYQIGDKVNDDIRVDNRISIIADAFSENNFQSIRYVKWKGALWNVISVEVQRPRLLLSMGRAYIGPTPS